MSTNSSIPAWQILGFTDTDMANGFVYSEIVRPRWWDGPAAFHDGVEGFAGRAVSDGMAIFASGAMGYVYDQAPLNDWREVGTKVVAAALYYFRGVRRDKFAWPIEDIDRARTRLEWPWSDYYRQGLSMAVSLSDWDAVDELIQWPGPDLPFDEGADDRTKEDNAYQIWLASRLRGEQPIASTAQRSFVERGSRRRPKMLMAAADALLVNDASGMATVLEQYLRYYRKVEFCTDRIDFGIAADATTLWHMARRHGLGEIRLSADAMLLIARP